MTAVATGQVDLATDYDRNFRAMIEKGAVKPEDAKIVCLNWCADELFIDTAGPAATRTASAAAVRNARDLRIGG